MLRVALIRGAASGVFTGIVSLAKVIQTGDDQTAYYGPVIIVAVISGITAVLVAAIYVIGPQLLKRRSERDPAFRKTHDEATDALVSELVRKEKEIQKLERALRVERDRRVDPPA